MWGRDGQPICFRLMTFLHKIGSVNEVNFKYSCSGLFYLPSKFFSSAAVFHMI